MFPLQSEAPVNCEFELTFVESHAAFTVDPAAGKDTCQNTNSGRFC